MKARKYYGQYDLKMAAPLDIQYGALLKIALPLSLGAFVQFLVVLTDNIFLSRVGETALNGAGNGGMLYVTLVMLGVGLSAGLQVMIARRVGEQRLEDVGAALGSGLRLSFILALLLFGVYVVMDLFLFDHILRSAAILEVMREFLHYRMFGLFIYLPLLMFTGFFTGIARTSILMASMGVTAGLNILFDWLLIFGAGPIPALAHEGAAIATLIAEGSGLLFLASYTFTRFGRREYHLYTTLFKVPKGADLRLLSLSYPLMIQQVLALATWTTFYFMVEKVGGLELKISHIVRNTYLLAFVTVMGIGYTTRTVISTLIAEHRQADLPLAMKRLIVLNVGGALLLCHGLVIYPHAIAGIFFAPDEFGVIGLVKSFRVVFFAVLIFSVTSILLNTIEGSGRTKQAMLIELVTIVIYLVLVYYITLVNPQEIHVIWMSDYLYFALLGVLCFVYLRFSHWKYTTV